MSVLTIPQIPQNQANGPKPGNQALVDNLNWKVGQLGQCVAKHYECIIKLYNAHNEDVEKTNEVVSRLIKELNENLIKTLAPQISNAAKEILEKDPQLRKMLAEAILRNQQSVINKYEERLKTLEKKVEELSRRSKL